jgi:hypothetical protein
VSLKLPGITSMNTPVISHPLWVPGSISVNFPRRQNSSIVVNDQSVVPVRPKNVHHRSSGGSFPCRSGILPEMDVQQKPACPGRASAPFISERAYNDGVFRRRCPRGTNPGQVQGHSGTCRRPRLQPRVCAGSLSFRYRSQPRPVHRSGNHAAEQIRLFSRTSRLQR